MKRIQISIYLDDANRLLKNIRQKKVVKKKNIIMESYADVVKRLLDEVEGKE